MSQHAAKKLQHLGTGCPLLWLFTLCHDSPRVLGRSPARAAVGQGVKASLGAVSDILLTHAGNASKREVYSASWQPTRGCRASHTARPGTKQKRYATRMHRFGRQEQGQHADLPIREGGYWSNRLLRAREGSDSSSSEALELSSREDLWDDLRAKFVQETLKLLV